LVALPPLIELLADPVVSLAASRIAILTLVPTTASLLAAAILRARDRVALGTIAELGSAPAIASLTIVVLALRGSEDLTSVMWAYLFATVLTAAWSFPMALRCLRDGGAEPDLQTSESLLVVLRGSWRSLSSMCGNAVLFYAMAWAPVIILGLVSTSQEVAYYAAAARVAALVTLVPAIQSSYLTPRFAALFHQGLRADLNRLAQRSSLVATVLAGTVALVIVPLAPLVLRLFGADFSGGVEPLRILATLAVLLVTLGQVNPLLVNCGLEHLAASMALVVLAAGSLMMLWSGSVLGAVGVAATGSLAMLTFASIGAIVLARKLGLRSWSGRAHLSDGGTRA
jgi:O-antigen/teichoic acid export membrane protein